MTIDIGTGDGRALLDTARRNSARCFIGIDANLASLIEASSRAARKPSRGGAPNTWFVRASAQALPDELAGVADRVTVLLPWGSLLAAVARPDVDVLRRIRAVARPNALLEVVVSLDERDTEASALETPSMGRLQAPFLAAGWRLRRVEPLDAGALVAVGTTWAKRLGHGRPRASWRISATTARPRARVGAAAVMSDDLAEAVAKAGSASAPSRSTSKDGEPVAYYVVGGEYRDTTFRELLKPAPVSGPFESYVQAYEAWRARARETVDQAYARFQIVQTMDAPPPGLPEGA